ncbi:hypothetical protein BGZ60DRAFT_255235 [Tricladium varicosporioides]|nr:hypothetical protein BGZ60DRAFT_255235 [Hymenoscyphus varicosporioides]
MFSLRTIATRRRGASISKQYITSSRTLFTKPSTSISQKIYTSCRMIAPTTSSQTVPVTYRTQLFRSTSTFNAASADELIEEIQDQYATARDEFEIATEETEKNSTYAEEDRKAAREELDKLKEMFESAVGGANGEEVKRRIGGRIRELDNAVVLLEEKALEHD